MLPQVVVLAQVLALLLMFLGGVIALSFLAKKLFFSARRPALPPDEPRLRRLEEGVDAIAVEIERMSEAQRFTTKLLAARATQDGAATGE
jgi:hypothetical protein